jgi:glycosyltransferase involved in cell wall biosynthesis
MRPILTRPPALRSDGRRGSVRPPMRVYFNRGLTPKGCAGSDAHIRQFLDHSVALGHEVWTGSPDAHPRTRKVPRSGPTRLAVLKATDVVYLRIAWSPPRACRWAIAPRRAVVPNAVHVWELNTVPEYGLLRGRSHEDVLDAVERFRRYGHGCDLAVCVSEALSDYARRVLGLRHVLTVPNGSDPDLFRPGVPRSATMPAFAPDALHVAWLCTTYVGWHDFALLRVVARMLLERRAPIVFHIIGEDDPRNGAPAAFMNGMPPTVQYHGAHVYEAVPAWLSAMHVGLCLYRPGPADYCSPLKLYDYMASGLAVCGTEQPQLRAVLQEIGGTQTLAPPGDAQRLVDILLGLARHPEQVHAMGAAGRRRVQAYYNWRRAVHDTYAAIAAVIAERLTLSGRRAAPTEIVP